MMFRVVFRISVSNIKMVRLTRKKTKKRTQPLWMVRFKFPTKPEFQKSLHPAIMVRLQPASR
jgi:hypothetical protein